MRADCPAPTEVRDFGVSRFASATLKPFTGWERTLDELGLSA
jgi:hypothetical protein